MSVFDLKSGQCAKIRTIKTEGSLKARLNSLGIREGETVECITFSTFKSSVLISCAAVRVGLRRSIAKKIEVEVIS